MSVGAWDPNSNSEAQPEIRADLLKEFVTLSQQDHLANLIEHLDDTVKTEQAALMSLPADHWNTAVASMNSDEIIHLIRFFTIAEMQLPGWEAGAKSPVIALNKLLKQRGTPLPKDHLLWIRRHSDNRFLPNGPL